MNRYPQCVSCQYRGRTKCLKDMKSIETTSMIFGICKNSAYRGKQIKPKPFVPITTSIVMEY